MGIISDILSAFTLDEFTIRTRPGASYQLVSDVKCRLFATQWAHTVRNRSRWRASRDLFDGLNKKAEADLRSLHVKDRDAGLNDDELREIAHAGCVEVAVGGEPLTRGAYLRRCPWEYWLGAATKRLRGERPLVVLRHLEIGRERNATSPPRRALLVESAPGALAGIYGFHSERRLIQANLALADRPEVLTNPTLAALEQRLQRADPPVDVIHLTGIDTHQGAQLLRLSSKTARPDGMYFADDNGAPEAIDAEEVGRVLVAGRRAPLLVAFNMYNSAAGLAAAAVARGCDSALGFQDEIDDTLAELFFANFYHECQRSSFDLREAFTSAIQQLRDQGPRLRGTGVTLWSGNSLLADQAVEEGRLVQAQAAGPERRLKSEVKHRRVDAGSDRRRGSAKTATVLPPEPVPTPDAAPAPEKVSAEARALHDTRVDQDLDPREELAVEPRPHETLNYSQLHNNRDLFESFKLVKLTQRPLRDILVEVDLYVGADRFPYRGTFDLVRSVRDIAPEIRLPLTWEFARALRETIRTSLFVSVTYRDQVLHCSTRSIKLLPTNEWRDNERDGVWLPSFVLPRDAAVSQVLDRAQRHLMALLDDAAAGFEGYDTVDPEEGVDLQVRAIWAALAFDFDIAYAPPPPTYSVASQRLRTPSDVLRERRGTCIDLSLLLAACLEYADIDAVIFLTRGHALAGYWRSREGRQGFLDAKSVLESQAAELIDSDSLLRADGQKYEWLAPSSAYEPIVSALWDDHLVPVQATAMARRLGFFAAIDEGIRELNARDDFDALLDISSARSAGQVTPLPLTVPA